MTFTLRSCESKWRNTCLTLTFIMTSRTWVGAKFTNWWDKSVLFDAIVTNVLGWTCGTEADITFHTSSPNFLIPSTANVTHIIISRTTLTIIRTGKTRTARSIRSFTTATNSTDSMSRTRLTLINTTLNTDSSSRHRLLARDTLTTDIVSWAFGTVLYFVT